MAKKFSLFLFLIVLFFSSTIVSATENEIISVNVFNKIYYGTLSTNDVSNNISTFTTLPTSDTQFTISGKWENNTFNKTCTITYSNGTTQSVTYKKGLISGNVITENPDGTYQTFSCTSGNPYGKICTFSEADSLIGVDYFYQCTPLRIWQEVAISVDYNLLMSRPYDYIDLPIKVHGTIDAIYETSKQCILKIIDTNNQLYIFEYQNIRSYKYSQATIENLSVGDTVDIIGIFSQVRNGNEDPLTLYTNLNGNDISYQQIESSIVDETFFKAIQNIGQISDPDLENAYPLLSAIYCTSVSNIDPVNLTDNYNDISRYPVYYYDFEIKVTGTVVYEILDIENNLSLFLIEKEGTSEIYCISYETDTPTSLLGEKITCSGILNGNHKITYYDNNTKLLGYILYPLIVADKLD